MFYILFCLYFINVIYGIKEFTIRNGFILGEINYLCEKARTIKKSYIFMLNVTIHLHNQASLLQGYFDTSYLHLKQRSGSYTYMYIN